MNIPFIYPERSVPENVSQPASYLRREFTVSGELDRAVLRCTALGVYQAFLNGEALDEQRLLPGFTDYHKRLQVQEYDVTARLQQGDNCLAAVVADGWYRGSIGLSSKRCFYGDRLMFGAELVIRCKDGREARICADENWRATQNGPLMVSDLKVLEAYDATKEMPGWDRPGFDDSAWHACFPASYSGACVPHEGEKILEQERFPAKVLVTPNGEHILDFGQNLAGHVEFTVTGHAGQQVSLVMGEVLDEHGNFTLGNLSLTPESSNSIQGPVGQRLKYTLKGGTQTYKSAFLTSGYRYAKPEHWPEEIKAENFTSIAIYSALPETGSFECSNSDINRLVQNNRWSMKSNFIDIPTDCPTRERAGWTGDINVYCETASYFADTRRFLKKWLTDFKNCQLDNGSLPYIVPVVELNIGKINYAL